MTISLSLKGQKAIELCLTIRNSTEDQAATRGVSTEPGDHDKGSYDAATLNENKIDKIELFLFDATTKNLIKSFGNTTVQRLTPNADPTQADSYKVRVVVPQSEVNNLEGKERPYRWRYQCQSRCGYRCYQAGRVRVEGARQSQ